MYRDLTPVVKCKHCGQWAAVFTACAHCGAPVDPEQDYSLELEYQKVIADMQRSYQEALQTSVMYRLDRTISST